MVYPEGGFLSPPGEDYQDDGLGTTADVRPTPLRFLPPRGIDDARDAWSTWPIAGWLTPTARYPTNGNNPPTTTPGAVGSTDPKPPTRR